MEDPPNGAARQCAGEVRGCKKRARQALLAHRVLRLARGGTALAVIAIASALQSRAAPPNKATPMAVNEEQLQELILQSLEHERGGIQVYENALRCAVNADLREEWEEYLDQTRMHEERLVSVCEALDIDSETPSPGREILRGL